METTENTINPLIERVREYGKTSFELLKLKTIAKASDVAATFVSRLILILILLLFALILNIALGLWLGELLGKNYYGFFALAFFYALIGLTVYFLQPFIKLKINNSIINNLTITVCEK